MLAWDNYEWRHALLTYIPNIPEMSSPFTLYQKIKLNYLSKTHILD